MALQIIKTIHSPYTAITTDVTISPALTCLVRAGNVHWVWGIQVATRIVTLNYNNQRTNWLLLPLNVNEKQILSKILNKSIIYCLLCSVIPIKNISLILKYWF